MQKLNVNEIFYSLQGEGARAGSPSIFIRLQDCNLSCKFCDTEFENGREMSLLNIYNKIKLYPCKWIIWTGGEPALQLTKEIINYFKRKKYFQAIETNGTLPIPNNLDWITLSPKVSEPKINMCFFKGVTELKLIIHKGQSKIPKPNIKAKYYFLQPQSKNDKINIENLKHCIKLCKENPLWRLSLQLHKIWKIK